MDLMDDPIPPTIALLKTWIKNTRVLKFTERCANEKRLAKPFHIYKEFFEDHRAFFKTAWEYEPVPGKPPGQVGAVYKAFRDEVLTAALSELRAEMTGGGLEPTHYLLKKKVKLINKQKAARAIVGWEAKIENLGRYRAAHPRCNANEAAETLLSFCE